MLDLVDYCHRHLVQLMAEEEKNRGCVVKGVEPVDENESGSEDEEEEKKKQILKVV